MNTPAIVSRQEWEAARLELRVKEKEHTRASDALAVQRRRMPWQAVEKEYRFEGPDGPASLLDLFDGRLAALLHGTPSMVSHHLAALEKGGLVMRERRGRHVHVRRTARGTELIAIYDPGRP